MIRARNVSKRYECPPTWALRGVSFEAPAGELIIVAGPSGSGKTTLLNLLGGLDRPTEGDIVVADSALGRLSDAALSAFRNRTVGFVFQTYFVHPRWSVADNVALPLVVAGVSAGERRRRAAELLGEVRLDAFAGQAAGTLSAGQRQRVIIARALACEPRVILADEPTASLESELAADIMRLLRRRADAGATVIVAQHRLAETDLADRRLELRDGRLQP